MKLYSVILEKFFDLPSKDPKELRTLLDDIGLEVKDIEEAPHGHIFTIETLANRGDHTYTLGVARELSGRLLSKLKHPPVADLTDRKASSQMRINTEKCSRVALLEMTFPASMPLREDVELVIGSEDGKRLPAIVNILNYVALELGQPMHAFDKDKIEGELILEHTTEETTIDALDGKQYKIPAGTLIHRDRKKILDVAGIIGCSNSMVTATTTKIVIEAAAFDPVMIRKTARAMGISTDASYTFERGSDREAIIPALKRVAYLMQGAGGQEGGHVTGLFFHDGGQTEKRKVTLHLPNLKKQLNSPRLPDIEVTTRLKNLGYTLDAAPEGSKDLVVHVPSWRLWDVENEEDLIEDFARSHGLNNIKLELPPLDYEIPPYNDMERVLNKIETSLVGNGFFEVITRSFYAADDVAFLNSLEPGIEKKQVVLKNSIESSYSHLKSTNILHFAALAAQNMRMNVPTVKIFEFGRLFSMEHASEERYEFDALCLAASGRWYENEWRKGESTAELYYQMKAVIESICAALGRSVHISESKHKLLHPGYQGAIVSGRETLGFFGVVHPSIRNRYELKGDLVYAEFDAVKLAREIEPKPFANPVDFPFIRRDITLKVGVQDFAGKVKQYIDAMDPANLLEVVLVDDFKKDAEDFRRVSYRLTFQNPERTLEHSEVDAAMQHILNALKEKHKLELAV